MSRSSLHRLLVSVAVALPLALAFAPDARAQAGRGTVRGKVVDAAGKPLADVELELRPVRQEANVLGQNEVGNKAGVMTGRRTQDEVEVSRGALKMKSGKNGSFRLSSVASGRYVVAASSASQMFLRHMKARVLDSGGLEVTTFEGEAGPDRPLPGFPVQAGLTIDLELQAADAATRETMRQEESLAAASDPLRQAATLFESGDFAGAAAAAATVTAQQPQLADGHFLHGLALQRLGKVDEAERELRAADALPHPKLDVDGALGSLLVARASALPDGDAGAKKLYAEAAERLGRAVNASAQPADALLENWTLALEGAGKRAEAVAAIERVIAAQPQDPQPYLRLYRLQRAGGDRAGALKTLGRVPGAADTVGNLLYNEAVPAYNDSRYDEALALAQQGLAKAPDHALLHRIAGRVYLAQGKNADALRELERFLALAPNSPLAAEERPVVEELKRQKPH